MSHSPAMNGVSVNTQQQLFVIPSGAGYSCRGFDNLLSELRQLNTWLNRTPPLDSERGTLGQYQQYLDALNAVRERGGVRETWFHADTPAAVRRVLEAARLDRTRVRVYYGDVKTGRSWLDEFETIGHIGRSTGLTKIPLLVPPRDDGGPALLDHCIVRIQETRTKKDLYRHPAFHVPQMRVAPTTETAGTDPQAYPWSVLVAPDPLKASASSTDWELTASFKTAAAANQWVEFMLGNVMATHA